MGIMGVIEDRFVRAIGLLESKDDWRAWGDAGMACGRYQQHASFYATWGPTVGDFAGREQTWDWAFGVALRRYFRAAWPDESLATMQSPARLLRIAMSYHLHGALVWSGWDETYADRFQRAWAATPGAEV
jgi:hypothetical protein